jgi:hypothetical protein
MAYTKEQWEISCDDAKDIHSPTCKLKKLMTDEIFEPLNFGVAEIHKLMADDPVGTVTAHNAVKAFFDKHELTEEQRKDFRHSIKHDVRDLIVEDLLQTLLSSSSKNKSNSNINGAVIAIKPGETTLQEVYAQMAEKGVPQELMPEFIKDMSPYLKTDPSKVN